MEHVLYFIDDDASIQHVHHTGYNLYKALLLLPLCTVLFEQVVVDSRTSVKEMMVS